MTILTKPSNEKKGEKVPLPLALGGHDDASSFRGGAAHGNLLGVSSVTFFLSYFVLFG